MTETQRDYLNYFFVHVFNRIQACEEQAINRVGASDLSVKELHVLAAVDEQTSLGQNTMTAIADSLSIRVSSLTTAVNTLVRKGYLERGGEAGDRRIIRVRLTQKGEEANRLHSRFHADMIDSVARKLGDNELEILTASLRRLDRFFTEMASEGKENISLKSEENTHGDSFFN